MSAFGSEAEWPELVENGRAAFGHAWEIADLSCGKPFASKAGAAAIVTRADSPKQYVSLAAIPLVIAVAIPVWQSQFKYGWLEMALGGWAWLFWIAVLAWAVCVVLAIKRFKLWWLLLSAPLILFPVVMAGVLLAACATGDCL